MQIDNGNHGTFCLSYSTEYKAGFEFCVQTDQGAVTISPTEIVLQTKDSAGEKKGGRARVRSESGVKQEVAAFAESIKNGNLDARGTPEQALADLQVLQAMLESGEEAGAVRGSSALYEF